MKKKIYIIVATIIIIISILLIGMIFNVIRNNSIMKKTYESSKELNNSIKNYYYEKKSELSEGETRTTEYKIYNYENKYLIKEYYNEDGIITTEWVDKNIPEYLSINEKTKEETQEIKMKDFDKEYEEALFFKTLDTIGYGKILVNNILKPIKIENNCYVIDYEDTTFYVNTNTGIISKVFYANNNVLCTYKLKNNSVIEEEVIKP